VTQVVLQNVEVLGNDRSIQRDDQGEPQAIAVITLLVTPEQAEQLAMASSDGRLQLALRNRSTWTPSRRGESGRELLIRRPVQMVRTSTGVVRPAQPSRVTVEVYRGPQRSESTVERGGGEDDGTEHGATDGPWLPSCSALVPSGPGPPSRASRPVAQNPTPITVAKGSSVVVEHPSTLERVLITDPEVADAVPVSGTEVVINGHMAGSTTLLLWGLDGSRATYTVRVGAEHRVHPGRAGTASFRDRGHGGRSRELGDPERRPDPAPRGGAGARPRASLSNGSEVVDHISVPDQPRFFSGCASPR
jgi:hypothetical protein